MKKVKEFTVNSLCDDYFTKLYFKEENNKYYIEITTPNTYEDYKEISKELFELFYKEHGHEED